MYLPLSFSGGRFHVGPHKGKCNSLICAWKKECCESHSVIVFDPCNGDHRITYMESWFRYVIPYVQFEVDLLYLACSSYKGFLSILIGTDRGLSVPPYIFGVGLHR